MTYLIGEVNGMRDAYLKVAETQSPGIEPQVVSCRINENPLSRLNTGK